MSNESWQKWWYDSLSRREKLHYHYNRKMFFDDGLIESIDRALGYPEWTEPIIDKVHSFGCLMFGHDMTGGYKGYKAYCIYCGKEEG
jgi:hypothetical protein